MAESALFQKLRRLARKFELQIHKLKGKNFFVLVDKQAGISAPMTVEQLERTLADLAQN